MVERANMTPEAVEEGSRLALDFGKLQRAVASGEGLVPVAVQDADSGEVLIGVTNAARRQTIPAFREKGVRKIGAEFAYRI